MKALIYHGPGERALENMPKPTIQVSTDAIIRITKTTICGTDLHIMKGEVPAVTNVRTLGYEGVGIFDTVTTPMLLNTVASGKLQPAQLITHHFRLDQVMHAYDTFGNAMQEHALKVIISNA